MKMNHNYQHIDLSYLLSASDDTKFLRKILSVFDEEYRELCKELSKSIENKDIETLKKTVHKAKSSVLMTIIPKGKQIILELENQIKENNPQEQQSETLNQFFNICEPAIEEINHAAKNI